MSKINFNGQSVEILPLSADERKNAPSIAANGLSDGLKDGDKITFDANVKVSNVSGVVINGEVSKPFLAYPCKVTRGAESFDYLITKSSFDARFHTEPNPVQGKETYKTVNETLANIGFNAQEKAIAGKTFTVKKVSGNTVASFEQYTNEQGETKSRVKTALNPVTGETFVPTKQRNYNQFIG